MIVRVYREESSAPLITGHYPKPSLNDLDFENKVDELMERFLDEVFGIESNLTRGEFITQVTVKSNWIFESEDVRMVWNGLCEEFKERKEFTKE